MKRFKILLLFLVFWVCQPLPHTVVAQTETTDIPFYLVQEGDTFWDIAARFGVSVEALQNANAAAGQLAAGMQLVIPGLQGYAGQVDTHQVIYGETLRSLSRSYGVSFETLIQLNRLVSPSQVYAGAWMVVTATPPAFAGRATLSSGETLLELAVQQQTNPWSLVLDNHLLGTWDTPPGEVLQTASSTGQGGATELPPAFTAVTFDPPSLFQGKTVVLQVDAPPDLTLQGILVDRPLNFFPRDGGYVALQGIHTLTEPGLYPLTLTGTSANGEKHAFSQMILVQATEYIFDPPLEVDPTTIDPAVTGPENELWASLGVPVTPVKLWDGLFVSPVPFDLSNCWTSLFGNRRSYNGSAYDYFHGGLDFCGAEGTELYAAAAGQVVFTGPLAVRGNAVVIDHGWGIYTAYGHLSQILVSQGDMVQPGQLVGLGGATGRTTGPHLHWEVWVGGVQVDPTDWLTRAFP
ncbi:MAG TPA: peptidoglycan DD-metalloendopeptidase family protein [Anaerolineales bacterium]|nr:peptidoglycan DD-metalloendopeptidase family protein [Anaerolineales bacterium]